MCILITTPFSGIHSVLRVFADEGVFLVYLRVPSPLGNPLVKQALWLRDGGMRLIIQPQETKNTTFSVCTQ